MPLPVRFCETAGFSVPLISSRTQAEPFTSWGEKSWWNEDDVVERTRGIGRTLDEVYSLSEERGITTEAAALMLARARLSPASTAAATSATPAAAAASPV